MEENKDDIKSSEKQFRKARGSKITMTLTNLLYETLLDWDKNNTLKSMHLCIHMFFYSARLHNTIQF